MFARTEIALNATIGLYVSERVKSHGPDGGYVLRAAIGGRTIGPAQAILRRLLRATNASTETTARIESAFSQLSEISTFRNNLVHNGAKPDLRNKDGWFYTDNSITIEEFDKFELVYFQLSTLSNMSRDLEVIPVQLETALFPVLNDLRNKPELANYYQNVFGPWHYSKSQLRRDGLKRKKQPKGK